MKTTNRKTVMISVFMALTILFISTMPVVLSQEMPLVYPVYGHVYNSTGAKVPAGVPVYITDTTNGNYVTVNTDGDGLYEGDIGTMSGFACDIDDNFKVNATHQGESGSCSFVLDPVTNLSQQCNINLTPLTIVVTPPSPVIIVGETQEFTATARDPTGSPMQGINITWTSSNTTVGTVSPVYNVTGADGKAYTTFTASAVGTATIKAENGTVSGTAGVTVNPDTSQPVITDVKATDITNSSATITWATDDESTSVVKYGTVSGSYPYNETASVYVKTHSVALTGLANNTKYYYVVNSTNSDGYSSQSPEDSFTTAKSTETGNVTNGSVTFTDPVVNETLTSISFVNITLTGTINVSSYAENPSTVSIPTTTIKTPVGYLSIDVPPGWENEPATIYFRVSLATLTARGIGKTEVKLYKLDEVTEKWNALTTHYDGVVDSYATYHAIVPSWSIFAISAAAAPAAVHRPSRPGVVLPPPVINVPLEAATGKVTSTTTFTVDGATLTIPAGVIITDAAGNPLSTSITKRHEPATAETVGAIAAYNFGPSGTTFSVPIDLVIAYDPADVPAGAELVIKMYDGTKWIDLPTTVDTVAHTATAKVSHFTYFALFAVAAAPTATPTIMPTAAPTATPTPTPTPLPAKAKPWGLIIGIIIAVVIVGAAAYYFYTKKKA